MFNHVAVVTAVNNWKTDKKNDVTKIEIIDVVVLVATAEKKWYYHWKCW